ncbi:ethylene-responsive transcription factor 3-like [Hibiscus syriacus]|uniref:glucan endo-1,3-beta-D-glucosidase n=1 Tax=Hibiscus syriacus TaxID=106335 RepID=A0A6A3BG28_HIBSY|nr:glucan endo-1,3-beta-glucosidase 12-like [Hibiscus syriacus]KAE8713699.1 ethylene-responsive transcription factor 3-like [Hibiscus syriacus]
MASRAFYLLVSAIVLLSAIVVSDAAGSVGINYGRVANNLPSPEKVVELLKSQGINKVKLYDTSATVLNALANSGISVVVALPNELLEATATDQSAADNWVQSNITKFYPQTKIEGIAVGNEVFVDPKNTTKYLVLAMKNIHASLVKSKLDSAIKISSPIAFSALQNSYPSSAGSFKQELVEPVIKPMVDFLKETGSYLMVNAYPFFAYSANSDQISLDYALFKDNPGVVDSGNGLKYHSLFEAQIDAVFAAMSAIKYDDVKMVVTETGWPSMGDDNEIGASEENAASYNGNLVRKVLSGSGTPLRPRDPLNVYLFALFNENQKPGPTSERNYGLFYPNEQKVYNIPLTQEEIKGGQSTPVNTNTNWVPVAGEVSKTQVGQTWCVANGKADRKKLQDALDYACGEGGADCNAIQPGANCYNPNSLEAHASFAFNSYYQKKTRAAGTCEFGGAAYVVSQRPAYGNCEFPTGEH